MRIALCQINSAPDPRENLGTIRAQVADAAAQGAHVVQFPEATQCRFGVPLGPVAEPLDGPWATAVREIADEHDVVVVAGMFTPGEGGRVTNTTLVTGAGLHLGYAKIHLYDAFGFRESDTVDAWREAGDVRGRRHHVRRRHLLRRALPRALPRARRHRPGSCCSARPGARAPARPSSGTCWSRPARWTRPRGSLACGQADPGRRPRLRPDGNRPQRRGRPVRRGPRAARRRTGHTSVRCGHRRGRARSAGAARAGEPEAVMREEHEFFPAERDRLATSRGRRHRTRPEPRPGHRDAHAHRAVGTGSRDAGRDPPRLPRGGLPAGGRTDRPDARQDVPRRATSRAAGPECRMVLIGRTRAA